MMPGIPSIRLVKAALVAVSAAAMVAGSSLWAVGSSAAARGTAAVLAVKPHSFGELDCNGFSTIQSSVKPNMLCADIRNTATRSRFYDNGWYIGHDEPSVRFISTKPGSGANVTFNETLGSDPAAAPTVHLPGSDVTHYFELTPAPWFSMVVCDPQSTPLEPCTPQSDANVPRGSYPGGGAAFMELQLYPPGEAPFEDNISCDNTHWCSALTIDSLECTAGFLCSSACPEPVNFAFLQTNGVPPGPPSPQLADRSSFKPNAHTLLMSPGDHVVVHIFDASVKGGRALETRISDLTTGKTGYAIASKANGFMNTNPFTCAGTPFNFQPEYSSAAPANILPWGPGAYNINDQFEIGHFEPCTSLSQPGPFTDGSFFDVFWNKCSGPYEAKKEGAETGGDAFCYPKGDTHFGAAPANAVTGCQENFNAAGDLDYDGSAYRRDWPSSTTPNAFPSTFLQKQPTSGGATYPHIQFVTDMSSTETGCNTVTGKGCVMPPSGPGHFYPYWTLAKVGGTCVWEFGNVSNGNTFGGYAQYGKVGPNSIGAFQGAVRRNPTSC